MIIQDTSHDTRASYESGSVKNRSDISSSVSPDVDKVQSLTTSGPALKFRGFQSHAIPSNPSNARYCVPTRERINPLQNPRHSNHSSLIMKLWNPSRTHAE